jgi:hypothetical protein
MTPVIQCTALWIQNAYLNLYWLYYQNGYHIEKDTKSKIFHPVRINFPSGKTYSHRPQ